MRNKRRREIDLYEKYATDDNLKSGLHEALMRMMEQMLNSPAMQSLVQNPEGISAMIQNNPQMRALM